MKNKPIYFKKFYRVLSDTDKPELNFQSQSEAENFYFALCETQRISCMEIIPSGGPGHPYYEGQKTIHLSERKGKSCLS